VLAVVGHTFSVFIKFRGGKGIATSLGAMIGLTTIPALLCFGLWAIVLGLTRYVSVASIVGCLAVPVAAWLGGSPPQYVAVMGAMGFLGIVKHIPNMKRLVAGTEPRIDSKKSNENSTS
jgi:glycerol-3-phosphate acyltransferase PlsY